MTKDEIAKASDIEIAYKIIEETRDNVNSAYLDSNWSDKVTYKTEGYLDGLVFCLDILKKVNGIREAALKDADGEEDAKNSR